ncbi:WXG100 family type VII secretion target [Streptacidiphilus carbonis]|jgi:WXG100 family type VII secretion target|uniref:WXG100 family type VII secretion target n=1 Tax=Streptacidiphilus carbonis TaxID=105422 RepID=UPI000694A063|nr:WXG100 family type VII secretion target [Streptacidiphilus carbonis]
MGVNSAIAGKVAKVLELLDIPWPGGDPNTLRHLASQWRSMAGTLRTTGSQLNTAAAGVVDRTWTGAAADAFNAHWKQQYQAFSTSAGNFDQIATELDTFATQAEAIIEEIVEIALEIAEMELAGALLTFVTAGISDAVSAAASGARALRIVKLVDRFIKLVQKGVEAIEKLIEAAKEMGRAVKLMTEFLVNGVKNTAMNFMGTEVTDMMNGSRSQSVLDDAKDSAFAGFAASGAGLGLNGLGRGATALVGDGAHAAPSRISAALDGFGKLFDGREGEAAAALTPGRRISGQVLSGGLTSAAGQSFDDAMDGKSTGDNIHDSVVSGITGGIGAGQVQHRTETAGAHEKDPLGEQNWFNITRNGRTYGEGGALNGAATATPAAGSPGSQDNGANGAVKVP